MNLTTHYNKFISEHDEFIKELAKELNHTEDPNKVNRVLRAVLYTLRNRLSTQQSFHILAQLPGFLKLYYVDGWKYRIKPHRYDSIEEFTDAVKNEQYHLGERDFNWDRSTEEIVNIVFLSLEKYLDQGTVQNILAELPPALHALFM
jgi:uncharacterized protein (DUF2267 family)